MTTYHNLQLKLAGGRSGRVALHLICLCRDGKLCWHARGVIRELQAIATHTGGMITQLHRRLHLCGDLPSSVVHDAVMLKRT